jgi:NAD dependent epimerase/dehydratase family enzyme
VPSFALRALFGEGAGPILKGRRAIPAKLERTGFTFRYEKLEEALAEALCGN